VNDIRVALDADNYLGESPTWSQSEQALWWVNCQNPPEVHRWHPDSGEHRKWEMPMRVGGLALKTGGGLLVALANGVYDFDPIGGGLTLRAPSPFPPHVMLHECHCDRQGRFWVGAYDHEFANNRDTAGAAFCRLDGDRLIPVVEKIAVANGLAFSPDGGTIYLSDSPTRRVDAYDLDPATGTLSNGRVFLTLNEGEGFVDGATVDAEGGYWLANVAAGALRRYLPDGTLDRIVALPFVSPTKPAFGGPDLRTLYVTSTKLPMPRMMAPTVEDGPVFALEPGETGLPDALFLE
jgi:sugar lactone lactonase YvrE